MPFTITETESTNSQKKWVNKRGKVRKETRETPIRFIGIDGEGVTLPDGTHKYVLLGVGDQQIADPNGLSWDTICEFLWEQFLENGTRGVAYVGFFLGYDFTQWIKQLPQDRAWYLLTIEGKARRKPKSKDRPHPFPVGYGQWEFDILGSKRFKLRKKGSKRWMNICDTGPFFQKSFMKVIDPKEWSEPVVSQADYDLLSVGKAKRATAVLDSDMLRYNARENLILSSVLERLDEGFRSLGISLAPGQWFGPGQAAQVWLKGRVTDSETLQAITPSDVLEAARKSYFGGWFEIMAHGYLYGKTHEYDINSAYPYIISTLPCLEHGTWIHNDPDTHWESPYTLVYAEVEGNHPYVGTMLHRDKKGNIYRPHKTEGWYWLHEVVAAKRAGLICEIQQHDWWSYHPCACPNPLREVQAIYNLRKEVGKKTPLGIACKLVPNSLYGKFAQSIGEPKYANPIYASLITTGCRTIILNAIATHPKGAEDVVMVATDGIYFRTEHPLLKISGELGDWDHNVKTNLSLFKPGVYWDDTTRKEIRAGNSPVFKSRGISAKAFGGELEFIDSWWISCRNRLNKGRFEWPWAEILVDFNMMTALQALMRDDWEKAGKIQKIKLKQSADPESKRRDVFHDGLMLRTYPRLNEPYEPSHEYEKRFGMEDPFSAENQEIGGIQPDGFPIEILREGLGL